MIISGGGLQRPEPFFDRYTEMAAIQRAWNSPGSGKMAMLYGRRRQGKTYLLQRFFTENDRTCCYYLADQSTDEVQRHAFAERLLEPVF